MTEYTPEQQAYIDSVGGEAHSSAVEIIGNLSTECRALRNVVESLKERHNILTHKVITCGVAASHPDPNLSRTGPYAGKWDSPQAQSVRNLRDRAARMEEVLMSMIAPMEELERSGELPWCLEGLIETGNAALYDYAEANNDR